jgi:hypothetical protein
MPKHPESQALFTRLLTEAGFRNDDGTYQRKRFCEETGTSPRAFKSYFDGKTHLSSNRLIELARKAGLVSFNIL